MQFEDNGIDASGMDYSKLTPLLVDAVNALRADKDREITSLRAENRELRAANEERFTRLESLVSQLTAENN